MLNKIKSNNISRKKPSNGIEEKNEKQEILHSQKSNKKNCRTRSKLGTPNMHIHSYPDALYMYSSLYYFPPSYKIPPKDHLSFQVKCQIHLESKTLLNCPPQERPLPLQCRGHCGDDCMVVGITTTCAISAYHHQRCEFEPHSGEVY